MIDNERKKKLLETMKSFNKGEKEDILWFGDEVEDQEVISTGIEKLDNFFGGGIKRGTHTILWGGYSVGKTSLALQVIANAQKEGNICAYINLEKPVDKERFIAMGVDLSTLVRSDCTKNAEQALKVIQKLCKAKVVDLIIVDSIQSLTPKAENENKGKERELYEKTMGELARTMSEFCRRVNPDIYRAKAGIIWIGQIRINIGSFFTGATLTGGEAIKFYAYQIGFMRRGQKTDAPVSKYKEYFCDPDGKIRYQTKKELIGFDSVIKMDKNNSSKAFKEKTEIHTPFLYKNGFVNEVIESEEIPITIDPEASEEERKKIENYLVEKGLLRRERVPIFNDEIPKEPEKSVDNHLKEKPLEFQEEVKKQTKKLKQKIEKPKKKKRGRPKKEKK